MLLQSKFVFITKKETTYNGRSFMKATIESDDEAMTIGTESNVVEGLEKYKEYNGTFKFSLYQGSGRLNLVSVSPAGILPEKK